MVSLSLSLCLRVSVALSFHVSLLLPCRCRLACATLNWIHNGGMERFHRSRLLRSPLYCHSLAVPATCGKASSRHCLIPCALVPTRLSGSLRRSLQGHRWLTRQHNQVVYQPGTNARDGSSGLLSTAGHGENNEPGSRQSSYVHRAVASSLRPGQVEYGRPVAVSHFVIPQRHTECT